MDEEVNERPRRDNRPTWAKAIAALATQYKGEDGEQQWRQLSAEDRQLVLLDALLAVGLGIGALYGRVSLGVEMLDGIGEMISDELTPEPEPETRRNRREPQPERREPEPEPEREREPEREPERARRPRRKAEKAEKTEKEGA